MSVTHPAKFSDPILPVVSEFLRGTANVLDPFAGTGRIHELGYDSWGIEIEPEWASIHPRTIVGNALALPFPDGAFDASATSPCYGNRMADHHNAKEKCRPCGGTGKIHVSSAPPFNAILTSHYSEGYVKVCEKCKGEGRRSYKRITYRHQLGRELHPDNAGAMQWGKQYREFHFWAWKEMTRVTRETFVLNISDHIRAKKVIPVTGFHLYTLEQLGWVLSARQDVETKRMGMGANRNTRVPHETVFRFIKRK